jgi:hypothetical protein
VNKKKSIIIDTPPPLSPLPVKPAPLSPGWQRVVLLIFALFVFCSLAHLIITPLLRADQGSFIQAPDEPAHWGYVRALAVGHKLPLKNDTIYKTYEWHQPPLYYLLLDPFYSAGYLAGRCISLLIGLAGLIFLFYAARLFFPDEPERAVCALAFAALLPMRMAVYSSIGNDCLNELCFTLFLLICFVSLQNGFTIQRAIGLGIIMGASLLTKATGMLLFPLFLLFLYYLYRENEAPSTTVRCALVSICLAALLTAPWFIRNLGLYHELTPIHAFQQEFAGTMKASDWMGKTAKVDLWTGSLEHASPMNFTGYLALTANWTFRTFWASWTPIKLASMGIPVFLNPIIYFIYGLLIFMAIAGLGIAHFNEKKKYSTLKLHMLYLSIGIFILTALSFLGFIFVYFQAQGRYLYPAILPLSILFALGYPAIIPKRYRPHAVVVFIGYQIIVNILYLHNIMR